MNVKFTKASKNDKTLVTVSLAQLDEFTNFRRLSFNKGDALELVIEGQPVVFNINRTTSWGMPTTAVTHCFPRFLRLPRVGRPVYAEVTEVL